MATLHEVCNEGVPMSIDVRKLGVWLLALGAGAMTVGIIADAVRTADDPTLATREGIFDLSGFPHALFFGGICVAVLGLFAIIAAKLYRPSERVTVGRRLLQVGAPLAAIWLASRRRRAPRTPQGNSRLTGFVLGAGIGFTVVLLPGLFLTLTSIDTEYYRGLLGHLGVQVEPGDRPGPGARHFTLPSTASATGCSSTRRLAGMWGSTRRARARFA